MLDTSDRIAFCLRWWFLGVAVGYWIIMALGLFLPNSILPAGDPMFR